jgi:hypothetical protein
MLEFHPKGTHTGQSKPLLSRKRNTKYVLTNSNVLVGPYVSGGRSRLHAKGWMGRSMCTCGDGRGQVRLETCGRLKDAAKFKLSQGGLVNCKQSEFRWGS